jgi:hypothetical protein
MRLQWGPANEEGVYAKCNQIKNHINFESIKSKAIYLNGSIALMDNS